MVCFSVHTQEVPRSRSPAPPNCPHGPAVSKSFIDPLVEEYWKERAVKFFKMRRGINHILKPFQVRLRLPLVLFVGVIIVNRKGMVMNPRQISLLYGFLFFWPWPCSKHNTFLLCAIIYGSKFFSRRNYQWRNKDSNFIWTSRLIRYLISLHTCY